MSLEVVENNPGNGETGLQKTATAAFPRLGVRHGEFSVPCACPSADLEREPQAPFQTPFQTAVQQAPLPAVDSFPYKRETKKL